MFWLGVAVTLAAGLLAVEPAKTWLRRRWPRITPRLVDGLFACLLLLGVAISVHRYLAETSEHQSPDGPSSQRQLSEDTKLRLLERLRAFPNKYELFIGYNLGDVEAQTLAEELSEVFQGAGWDPPSEHGAIFTPPLTGIRLHASRPPPPELIEALRPLFDQFGDEPTPFRDSGVPSGVTEIVIGTRSR